MEIENKKYLENMLNRWRLVELSSDDAAVILPAGFDFVWIDGDHSYEQCKKDILNYLPLVKKPGICGGHDYEGIIGGHNCEKREMCAHPGVWKAVEEVFRKKDIHTAQDLTWWVYV